MTEVETYYDSDGPGPDCGGFPFGESIYTLEAKSYLTTSAEAGSYWKIGSEHETEYSRSTNVAAKYYELSLTDPDDIQTATRKDHCDNYSKVISTYLDGGTNTLTLQTNYDKLGRETKELISKGVEIDKKVALAYGEHLTETVPLKAGQRKGHADVKVQEVAVRYGMWISVSSSSCRNLT